MPTWVAARPMPSASCMRRAHPLDLGRQARRRSARPAAPGSEHRVAELAHVQQRGVAARAGLGIELGRRWTPPARPRRRHPRASCVRRWCERTSPESLGEALAGARYCGSTSTLKLTPARAAARGRALRPRRRPRRPRRARSGRLDHELAALAAAQAKQRRRAEHAAPRRPRQASRTARAAARRAAPGCSAEQTTRIRCENGG